MARKKEGLDLVLSLAITKTMRQEIEKIAEHDERRPTEMARILITEAIQARKDKASGRQRELATA